MKISQTFNSQIDLRMYKVCLQDGLDPSFYQNNLSVGESWAKSSITWTLCLPSPRLDKLAFCHESEHGLAAVKYAHLHMAHKEAS